MRTLKRCLTLAVLASFLGLAGAEWSHAHKELTAAPATDCSVCKITHQTPALTPTTHQLMVDMVAAGPVAEKPLSLHRVFTSTAHGLSPPAL